MALSDKKLIKHEYNTVSLQKIFDRLSSKRKRDYRPIQNVQAAKKASILTSNQILQNANKAILAQANIDKSKVMSLLQV